ncbi:EAL domain-containing protein [Stenotrophomonas sp. SRS1]|uniref:putative bifunctional diguanylate cyclase/phosphodiesterase n=1 Tax=Stenotrophomonas sp. SRS1 TaxID=2870345 RepID=UPI0022388C4E|nr:EAL domain-containing protein [Stenotrophomonas sp. SRS1]
MLDRSNDVDRIALIEALNVMDPALGTALDPIAELTAFSFGVPIAWVSILDADHQHIISGVGLALRRTDRHASICARALGSNTVMQVADLRQDPRFADNPLVTGPEQLRFYAGAPLVTKAGVALGTLCIMDRAPRQLSAKEQLQLQTLSRVVVAQMELKMSLGRREQISGLPNRHQFQADLNALSRHADTRAFTAVVLDVFDLQSANDAGQALGMKPVETLLRQAALRVQDVLRDMAQVYHIGVTRFAFLLADHSHEETEALLDRLRIRMRRPLMAGSIPMSPQFHAGVCDFLSAPGQTGDLVRKCLVAMHHAIQTDSCLCWYSQERDDALRRRYRLASDAGRGLAQHQFSLVYQPRFDLITGLPVSAEALLRWTHPMLGPVSPGEFIPVLERTALMPAISRWVIDHALAQAAQWQKRVPDFSLSLNLSPRDFDDQRVWSVLSERLHAHGLAPGLIEIEITEGQWLNHHPAALPQLREMAAAGVRIAIDDFGSGYSNFGYLSEVPISHIKIDQTLVTGLARSRTARLKVEAIIKLARQLGYRTVAEGVENEAELSLLRLWGCDEAQGYHLARPMHPDAVLQLVSVCRAGPLPDAG